MPYTRPKGGATGAPTPWDGRGAWGASSVQPGPGPRDRSCVAVRARAADQRQILLRPSSQLAMDIVRPSFGAPRRWHVQLNAPRHPVIQPRRELLGSAVTAWESPVAMHQSPHAFRLGAVDEVGGHTSSGSLNGLTQLRGRITDMVRASDTQTAHVAGKVPGQVAGALSLPSAELR